jgi:hypothetical protein
MARRRQDAEKVALLTRPTLVRQDAPFTKRLSRIVQILNVPQKVRLGPSLAAALLDKLFEHPANDSVEYRSATKPE